jgi:hypothetical protein
MSTGLGVHGAVRVAHESIPSQIPGCLFCAKILIVPLTTYIHIHHLTWLSKQCLEGREASVIPGLKDPSEESKCRMMT